MALSPEDLIKTFQHPKLTDNDRRVTDRIEQKIDGDIIRIYGRRYNANPDFIPDGFKCTLFIGRLLRTEKIEHEVFVKAYLLNTYKKLGWDIIVANDWGTWDIQFNKARLRDNNIDEILDEIDGEDIESED